MERLRIRPVEEVKKTARLLREFPKFQSRVQPVIGSIVNKNPNVSQAILDHYGRKYEEMGFCTKSFADMVSSGSDNTDIGICATEFYIFIDILDDIVDDPCFAPDQKVEFIRESRELMKGGGIGDNSDLNLRAMNLVSEDLLQRVIELSSSSGGVERFIERSVETINELHKETRPHSQKRTLVAAANVGRKCAYPLIELINCKFGESMPYVSVGNLVAIGNILDDYWDIVKDKKAGKSTFLTMTLPDVPMDDPEVMIRSIANVKNHKLVAYYTYKLLSRALGPLDRNKREDALSIAFFAQIEVLKRRFDSVKRSFTRSSSDNLS